MGGSRIELLTSTVSTWRSPAELTAHAEKNYSRGGKIGKALRTRFIDAFVELHYDTAIFRQSTPILHQVKSESPLKNEHLHSVKYERGREI